MAHTRKTSSHRPRRKGQPAEEPPTSWTEKAKAALVTGGEVIVKGAKAAESGLTRYAAWVEKKNAEAIVRNEREREEAIERRRRALDRQRTTIDLQREQRQLDLEERRMQLELQREELAFQREFGVATPPHHLGSPLAAPARRGTTSEFNLAPWGYHEPHSPHGQSLSASGQTPSTRRYHGTQR